MKIINTSRPLGLFFISALFLSLLSGCGGQADSANQKSTKQNTVKLTIINEQGEVKQGTIVVQDLHKKELMQVTLDGTSPYKLTINSGAVYPLIISVSPDPKVYEYYNQPLKAILAGPLSEKLRISAKSTSAIDYIETQLGAVYSKENIANATLATLTPDFRPARSYKGGMAKISGK